MKDLKFEQKRSLSRAEAAELLAGLAEAFREGGEAELTLGPGVELSLRVPDEFRTEVEFEVDDGEIELEIELKWPLGGGRATPATVAASARKAVESGAAGPGAATGPAEEQPEPAAPAEPSAPRSRKATSAAKPKRPPAKRTPAKRTAAKRS
ncbi:amphi-Trp domain-containing protein [Streptomyces sp. NPDC101160]|uniref:amphi-Trp domain-containing protein n=1 Tax=Streptomyces sp. NPDC101160 TaxID=3366118 RepID=UPI003826372D